MTTLDPHAVDSIRLADTPTRFVGPALVTGFAATVVLFCAWFILHHPAIRATPPVAGGVLLVLLGVCMVLLTRGATAAVRTGMMAGLIVGLLQLVLIGGAFLNEASPDPSGEPGTSNITTSPHPGAPIAAAGFIGLCVAVGAAGGMIGGRLRKAATARPHRDWITRFAIVTACSIAPLIIVGGIVTSTESGLAVPDWPTTYGANMFLYPINLMTQERVFEEHAHRLLGALVGLTTMALAIYTLIAGPSQRAKWFAIGLFVLVVVQGILGGLRVSEQAAFLGVFHGMIAQVFLALTIAFAVVVGRSPAETNPAKLRQFSLAFIICLFVQLFLGAAFRHMHGANPESSGTSHIIWTHAAFAVVVSAIALFVGFTASAKATDRRTVIGGRVIIASVAAQIILGVAAFVLVLSNDRGSVPFADELATAADVPIMESVTTTAHQANGALLLAMATLVYVTTAKRRSA